MKLYKKNLGARVMVTWEDARSEFNTNLPYFLKCGFAINESMGWLLYFDKDRVVIAPERTQNNDDYDLTMIPLGWVKEVEFLDEK